MLREEKIQTHAPTTPALHHDCTVCLQYKRLRKKGLHCAWCDVREFKYRSNSDDIKICYLNGSLCPAIHHATMGLKTCVFFNSYFKLYSCLGFTKFHLNFQSELYRKVFEKKSISMRHQIFFGPIVAWLDRNGFSL